MLCIHTLIPVGGVVRASLSRYIHQLYPILLMCPHTCTVVHMCPHTLIPVGGVVRASLSRVIQADAPSTAFRPRR